LLPKKKEQGRRAKEKRHQTRSAAKQTSPGQKGIALIHWETSRNIGVGKEVSEKAGEDKKVGIDKTVTLPTKVMKN